VQPSMGVAASIEDADLMPPAPPVPEQQQQQLLLQQQQQQPEQQQQPLMEDPRWAVVQRRHAPYLSYMAELAGLVVSQTQQTRQLAYQV
jgi:hypothetical protein